MRLGQLSQNLVTFSVVGASVGSLASMQPEDTKGYIMCIYICSIRITMCIYIYLCIYTYIPTLPHTHKEGRVPARPSPT